MGESLISLPEKINVIMRKRTTALQQIENKDLKKAANC